MYPTIVLIVAVLSLVVLLTLVLPQFAPLFESTERELPLLTRGTIRLGDAMQRYWWALGLGGVAVVWLARREWSRPASRARIDAWLLRLPRLGPLLAKFDTARLARTLVTRWRMACRCSMSSQSAQNTVIKANLRAAIGEAATVAKEGRGVAEPLGDSSLLPALAVHLIPVGECSGRLESMLLKIAEVFDRDVRVPSSA